MKILFSVILMCFACVGLVAQDVEYGVGRWSAEMGNHRAVVSVNESSSAVWAHLPWRRLDEKPSDKDVVVVDLKTGRFVANVAKINITKDFGDIVFQPATVPGEYGIYYYPLELQPRRPVGATNFQYADPQDTANQEWLMENGLNEGRYFEGNAFNHIPKVDLLRFEARSELDRFDPMELPATEPEMKRFLRFNQGRDYILFPEDRTRAIRMRKHLPVSWLTRASDYSFTGQAQPGEFYSLQIGVYAQSIPLNNLAAAWTDLRSDNGEVISSSEISCITLEGFDGSGDPLSNQVSVPEGEVRALWFVVRVPNDVTAGQYRGQMTITPEGAAPQSVDVALNVSGEILADGGVGDLWRMSRLAWLNSRAGQQDGVTYPYEPMSVNGQSVRSLGKEIVLGRDGLPQSIKVAGEEVLASPIKLHAVGVDRRDYKWSKTDMKILRTDASVVAWQGVSSGEQLDLVVDGRMEYDGYVFLKVSLRAKQDVTLADVKIDIPYRQECAEYFMGFGKGPGGYRPSGLIEWKWSDKPTNKVWMGSVEAGLQVKLRGPAEQENVWSNYRPEEAGIPESWNNSGRGGATIKPQGKMVKLAAYTGAIQLELGSSRTLCLSLIPTPVKPRNPNHWTDPSRWNMRYSMMASASPQQNKILGANDITAFHSTPVNPWINYPFRTDELLKKFVGEAHELGLNARLYYTVRELSNHAAELWPLWSMKEEFFVAKEGGGGSWLQEHLRKGYSPAWHCVPYGINGLEDQAVHTSGWNRWLNYYVKSVDWLTKERDVDGLYFDGISMGRRTFQRLRRVGDANRPNFRMDYHSGNTITRQSNAYNDCLEVLPYIDSTWIGEGFNYEYGPDFYMVEITGIPFGLSNDMLQYGGNVWRGMLYGMASRYIENHSASPSSLWQFWDEVGIKSSRMIGYWDKQSPVSTGHDDVLATVYKMQDKTLVAIASWADEDVNCKLTIDYSALGLDPSRVNAYTADIPEFQSEQLLDIAGGVLVPQGRGCIFILTEEPVPAFNTQSTAAVQHISLDQDSVNSQWSTKKPNGSDAELTTDGEVLAVSGSMNTYAYIERDLPAGVTGVQSQMRIPGLESNRVWHERHTGLNAPGIAVVFANGKSVRASFASSGVLAIEDELIDHMYRPVLQLRGQDGDTWSWVRIRWTNEDLRVECSVDAEKWECVRILPRALYDSEIKSIRLGKLPKTYGWPRTLKFENTGGSQTGEFRSLHFISDP